MATHLPANDANLLADFLAGDDDAFASLVDRHGPAVRAVCRRLLGESADADDAEQVTFLILMRRAAEVRDPARLGAWLYGVARRVALKARASRERRRSRESPAPLDAFPAPAAPHADPDVRAAVAALPPGYRRPVELCYLAGRSCAEAGRELGLPPATVATRLARARAQLRDRLRRAMPIPAPERNPLVDRIRAALAATALALLILAGGAGLWSWHTRAADPPPAPPRRTEPPAPDGQAAGADGWRTANFLVTAPDRATARAVAEEAERQRHARAVEWLGRPLPDWSEPCPVSVKSREGGGVGGASTFTFGAGKTARSMEFHGPPDRVVANIVPHEVTHAVLADAAGRALPRWADEGAAVLSEPAAERERHEKLCRELRTAGRCMPLRKLFALREYPPDVMVLYAQGASVAGFLVARENRPTFLAFVLDGSGEDGWDRAAKKHYGFADVEALQAAWVEVLKADPPTLPAPPPAGPPATAAPETVAARLTGDEVVIRRRVLAYVPVQSVGRVHYEARTLEQPTTFPLAAIRVTRLPENRAVAADELRRLLREERPVLFATDGRPPDSFSLQLYKDGTLLLMPVSE